MNLCETCKHWDKEEADDTYVNIGLCRKAVFYCKAFDHEGKISPEYKDAKLFPLDGDSYHAELITRNTFGCVMHEEKNT